MSDSESAGRRQQFSYTVDEQAAGHRVDAFLARQIAGVSRAQIRRSIDAGFCQVDGRACKASHRLVAGEVLFFELEPARPEGPQPEAIDLDVLYEDESLAAINKPAGMVVHPSKGHWSGTLASAVVHRYGSVSTIGGGARPGIVHRLDRDTSGVIVIARTDAAHRALAQQFHDRTVGKQYLALVTGCPDRDADRVVQPIGPHPSHREKMAIRNDHPEARSAETFYEVAERFQGFSLLRVRPKTGRTHQIRLHLTHVGHSVLCDRLYGGRAQLTVGELRSITRSKRLAATLATDKVVLQRQALHAHRLTIDHPESGERVEFKAPLADDIERVLLLLRETARGN